jgi:hypothetical protein
MPTRKMNPRYRSSPHANSQEQAIILLKKVLVPTDFREQGAKEIRYGVGLAANFGAERHLFHAVQEGRASSSPLNLSTLTDTIGVPARGNPPSNTRITPL